MHKLILICRIKTYSLALNQLHADTQNISVIVPVFNEELNFGDKLSYFKQLAKSCEVIFVDGNSTDQTIACLKQNGFTVINALQANRGAQLYKGILQTNGEYLLLHHLDSELPENALNLIEQALETRAWGRFDIRLDSYNWKIQIVQKMMNLRSRWTGIATGDQAMFMRKDVCLKFADNLENYPVMEDIYLSKQLKKSTKAAFISAPVVSSARYWETHGVLRSVIKMWMLRSLYFFGMSPSTLYKLYYRKSD